MANQNTPEYMDKIKTRLFENLRMLPHAPGVQMQGECWSHLNKWMAEFDRNTKQFVNIVG